jgi:D-alanyl-D-alanine carboxypeptidase
MKNETFKEIVGTQSYSGEYRSFVNKNKILNNVEGANGVKTGYTQKAGRCLVSSVERGNMSVVCVVLNCPDMYERSEQLINDSFDNFAVVELKDKVFMSDIIPSKLNDKYSLVVKKGQEIDFKIEKVNVNGKIKVGDLVGILKIYCQNDLIFCQNLYSIISE